MNLSNHPGECQLEDVAAYLDGELSDESLLNFERHLATCSDCATELRTQRQLLCTLDVAFNDSAFKMPPDFTRVVRAHAEGNLGGVRWKGERRRALQVCIVLALLSFALLGATAARALVLEPAQSFLHLGRIFFDLAWRLIFDAGTGLAVIVRVLGRAVVFDSHGLGLAVLLGFILSTSLLSFLIARYHRAQIIE
jgi:anti-sigma factor RsiW